MDRNPDIEVLANKIRQDGRIIRLFVAMLIVTALLTSWWSVRQLDQVHQTLRSNREVLSIVQDATSPEAVREQQRVVEVLVAEVDCNNREALQQLVDQLNEGGQLGPITVSRSDCGEP